jgi:hypothetical protein
MEEVRTIDEVLLEAVNVLNNLTVPIAMVESIGVPIAKVKNNLMLCVNALAEERKKAESAAAEKEQGGESE